MERYWWDILTGRTKQDAVGMIDLEIETRGETRGNISTVILWLYWHLNIRDLLPPLRLHFTSNVRQQRLSNFTAQALRWILKFHLKKNHQRANSIPVFGLFIQILIGCVSRLECKQLSGELCPVPDTVKITVQILQCIYAESSVHFVQTKGKGSIHCVPVHTDFLQTNQEE